MLHAEVGVEEQIGVDVRLAQVVGDGAIIRILLVKRPGQDEGYATVGLVVEHVTILREHLTAQRTDVDAIQRIAGASRRGMRRLTVLTRLMDQLHAHLRDVILAVIKPAVEDVELLRERQIEEAVAVGVVGLLVARIVSEEARGEVLREADGGVGIALHAAGVGGEEVERKGRRLHGLLVLHVDLPRDRLVAVAHRRAALRHLDALHPRRRHIIQPEERSGTAEVGHILGKHLHIRAGQAQQADLLGARGRVGIGDVDRGVRLEALREVAAGGTRQLLIVDLLGLHRGDTRLERVGHAPLDDHLAHLLHLLAEDDGQRVGVGSGDVDRVRTEADIGRHESVGGVAAVERKISVGVGRGHFARTEQAQRGADGFVAVVEGDVSFHIELCPGRIDAKRGGKDGQGVLES